jgi:hypothetical protein
VDITTTLPALRRHALATAWPVESIDHGAKHYERDPFNVSHDRPDRRSLRHAGTIVCLDKSMSAPVIRSGASLEVSHSPATLAGCARAVRGGQPPDDPASAFPSCVSSARAPSLQGDLPTRMVSFSPLRFSAGADSLR